uniref:Uncharacterized protein n=1 Tax=Oryza glumipatula TaxID=40148 RepID=A0A0D9Z8B5_9ORYZ
MELPWAATNMGEMVATMAGGLAHQRTPVQLLLFVCQNELNAPVALGRVRSDTGHPEQWTVEQASSSIDFGMIERTMLASLNEDHL